MREKHIYGKFCERKKDLERANEEGGRRGKIDGRESGG